MVYYNEWEPYPAQWLRNLIAAGELPEGEVDETDFNEIDRDLGRYEQAHLFAGIGGWAYALKLAGWEGPCWTASCPCQGLSSAGNFTAGDLWPALSRTIRNYRPRVVFGEQVASGLGPQWFHAVRRDLDRKGYAVDATVLCGSTLELPRRRRIFFVAYTDRYGKCDFSVNDTAISRLSEAVEVAELERRKLHGVLSNGDGLPGRMAQRRAYGNSLIPQVAAAFVMAFMEAR